MNRSEFEEWAHRYRKHFLYKVSEDSSYDDYSLESRYNVALVLGTYSDEKLLAIKMMQTIVDECVSEKRDEDMRFLVLAHIAIGKLHWQHSKAYRTTQCSFDRALAVIDEHPELVDWAGKVFYERCLILSDMEKGDIALQMAFELVDSYDLYGNKLKSKKMFYVYMAIAAIAKEEWIYDIGIDYLWRAFHQLTKLPKPVSRFCKAKFKHRNLNVEETFHAIHDQLEQYL